MIRIRDNGGGITYDIINRNTEPYFKTKPRGKRNSMGLYFTRSIVEHNIGGQLTVANTQELGETGAKFCIDFKG